MRYIEQEESYTSQASCLDLDDIPVYNPEQPYTGTFSGKRIHRGLYQFADGRIANADVNGAYTTYSVKVSRTSISRDCVRGFWTAL